MLHPRSSARSRRAAPLRGSSSRACARRPRPRDSRTRCSRRSAELESATGRAGRARWRAVPARRCVPRRARRARASGSRRHASACRRAAARAISTRGRAARLRIRVRGSDRRRVGACSRRSLRERRSRSRSRTSPGAPRSRHSSGRSRISRRWQVERSRSFRVRRRARVPAALAHLERGLFSDEPEAGPPIDGAIRFLEGAGARGTVELACERRRRSLRGGHAPERVAVVCESPDRWRAPLGDGAVAAPRAVLDRAWTPPRGHAARPRAALRSSVRVARRRARRSVRVPALAVLGARASLRRLRRGSAPRAGSRRSSSRGRGERAPPRRARPGARRAASGGGCGRCGARASWTSWCETHGGRVAPRRSTTLASILAPIALPSARSTSCARSPSAASRSTRRTSSRRSSERGSRPRARDRARRDSRPRACTDTGIRRRVRSRARGGSVPAACRPSPLLSDDVRRELGGRLERPDSVARDRYLFYTTCTRAAQRLVLVREAAGDEGTPREPSPFWEDVTSLFDDAEVAARDAAATAVGAHVAAGVGAERARAPARPGAARGRGHRRSVCPRGRERLVTTARPCTWRVRPRHRAAQPGCAGAVRGEDGLLRDRARAVCRLLVGVARRARDRPEADRRRARSDPPWPGRCIRHCIASTRCCRASSTPSV